LVIRVSRLLLTLDQTDEDAMRANEIATAHRAIVEVDHRIQ
jgi:hypothetical protein